MEDIEQIKEKTIVAWYAPEIPINQGPDKYWGLPGLILEVNDGTTILLCSKIALNVKDKADIKAPKTGKVVTQKEYDETVKKKMEEMREMYGGQVVVEEEEVSNFKLTNTNKINLMKKLLFILQWHFQ